MSLLIKLILYSFLFNASSEVFHQFSQQIRNLCISPKDDWKYPTRILSNYLEDVNSNCILPIHLFGGCTYYHQAERPILEDILKESIQFPLPDTGMNSLAHVELFLEWKWGFLFFEPFIANVSVQMRTLKKWSEKVISEAERLTFQCKAKLRL